MKITAFIILPKFHVLNANLKETYIHQGFERTFYSINLESNYFFKTNCETVSTCGIT